MANVPRVVYFQVPGDPDTYFAVRRADGQYWACNRFRGRRLCGLFGRRGVRLVGGERSVPVRLVEPGEEMAA